MRKGLEQIAEPAESVVITVRDKLECSTFHSQTGWVSSQSTQGVTNEPVICWLVKHSRREWQPPLPAVAKPSLTWECHRGPWRHVSNSSWASVNGFQAIWQLLPPSSYQEAEECQAHHLSCDFSLAARASPSQRMNEIVLWENSGTLLCISTQIQIVFVMVLKHTATWDFWALGSKALLG